MNPESKIPFLIPVFCLLLSACGFSPIYGTHENGADMAAEMNSVAIGNIPDRHGQMLRNNLIDRMYGKGRPASPKYQLDISLTSSEQGLGVLPSSIVTLTELNLYAAYTLKTSGGETVAQGTAHALTTYDLPSEQYSALAARESAFERAIREVGEQLVNRVSLALAQKKPGTPAP